MDKVYCPTCGQSRESRTDDVTHFALCNKCADHRDKRTEHSEEDVQEEIKNQIDLTVKQSYR